MQVKFSKLMLKAPQPVTNNVILKGLHIFDQALIGGAFNTADYFVEGTFNILNNEINSLSSPPLANDNEPQVSDRLKPIVDRRHGKTCPKYC